MAVLTAQGISAVGIGLLVRELALPRTVTIVPGAEFAGSNGDTITVRVPQPGDARTQDTPGAEITFDDTDEIAVPLQVAHLYKAIKVTDEDLSLNLEDFGRQITRPQVKSIAIGAENQVASAMNALAADSSIAIDGSDVEDVFLTAREAMGTNDVPASERFVAVSPQVASFLLALDKFTRVDASGSASALRDAVIGRIYGFTVVESNALTAGTAVFYHRSGFAFANRVPVVPRGVHASATASEGGVGMRQIFQYMPTMLSDASVVSTFAGAAAVWEDGETATDSRRFYKVDTAAA